MSLGSIIRERRRELGLTQESVAGDAEMSKPYLSNIETDKVINPPSDGKLRSLERVLGFRPGELVRIAHLDRTPADVREQVELLSAKVRRLEGRLQVAGVEPGGSEAGKPEPDEGADAPRDEFLAGRMVPIINGISAGYPRDVTDLDYPPGTADDYIRCPDVHDPQAFAARVVGDSMAPEYQEGDVVIFSPALEARSGDDCFIRFGQGEGTTFKRIYEDDEKSLRLQPLNNTHRPQVVARERITGVWPALFRVQRVRRR